MECDKKPCQSVPQYRLMSGEEANTWLRRRPVLGAGVLWIGVMRRFLFPRTCERPRPTTDSSSSLQPSSSNQSSKQRCSESRKLQSMNSKHHLSDQQLQSLTEITKHEITKTNAEPEGKNRLKEEKYYIGSKDVAQSNSRSNHYFKKQGKYSIDSSSDGYEDLYSRRT